MHNTSWMRHGVVVLSHYPSRPLLVR